MISFHTIGTIAGYEMRTLLRSWFFRIFAALTIFSLGIFNLAIFIESSGSPWIYRALPASLPYANLIILNLGQAIVAVFLASEFLKQDKKNDTVEVIYARSMTNSEYITGKTIGILAVFFILNLIVLVVGVGFSFLSTDSSRGLAAYLIYPLLISLPTLIFIIGLSFLLMIVIKNQAITFILLLGYIALSVFYLNTKFYNLPDFIAYHIPMMHSTISGFGQINEILIHRGIFFSLGLGFIFFTVYKLGRLPQSARFQNFPLLLALIFMLVGVFLMFRFVGIKEDKQGMKRQFLAINSSYHAFPRVQIDTCKIELEHRGSEIFVDCELAVSNKTTNVIDTIILSLNPFLNVSTVKINHSKVRFIRDLHILKLASPNQLKPGSATSLQISYAGKIDENIHFLDQEPDHDHENFSVQIYAFRKHYAWLQDNFVCLTGESLWYPVSGTGYSRKDNHIPLPDFTIYTLNLKTSDKLMALSQGESVNHGNGSFYFKADYALPGISLLIGDYNKYKLEVDSVEYNLFVHAGNDYFSRHFEEIRDSIPYLIRELKNEYEVLTGLKYPYQRFNLAEVPAEFALDKHFWSVSSNAVQPELIFVPEKGIYLSESDFKRRIKREEKRMKRDKEEILPEELQARIFKKFVRNNFMAEPDQYFEHDIVDRNTFSVFPQFYTFSTQLYSDKWLLLNIALESYLKERNVTKSSAELWWSANVDKGEQINLELRQSSLNEILKSGISKVEVEEGRINLNDILMAKGNHLFSLFRTKFGDVQFNRVLDEMISKNRFKKFTIAYMDSVFVRNFGKPILNELDEWYNGKQIPGFLVKDLETFRIKADEYTKFQIRFKISNPEPVDGIITIFVEMAKQDDRRRGRRTEEAADFSKKIYLPAKSSKEIGLVFPAEPARMRLYTHISQNLPNNLNYDFSSFEEVRKTEAIDSTRDILFFKSLDFAGEFIVDNEDEGFEYTQSSGESYLKSLVKKLKKEAEGYKYSRIQSWNPPGIWKSVLKSEFYGQYVRSAMYTKSGDGQRMASWKAAIGNEGNFDVYCHMVRITNEWSRKKDRINYNFKIYHNQGFDEISLYDEDIEPGWVYLGTYTISPENAKVELSNKSTGNMVIADAVKWVRNN